MDHCTLVLKYVHVSLTMSSWHDKVHRSGCLIQVVSESNMSYHELNVLDKFRNDMMLFIFLDV